MAPSKRNDQKHFLYIDKVKNDDIPTNVFVFLFTLT